MLKLIYNSYFKIFVDQLNGILQLYLSDLILNSGPIRSGGC